MSSVLHLRQFISERLNAAAEAIFIEVEKTIIQYEEEIDRQRKLVDIQWKPQSNVHTAEVPHRHVCKVDDTVKDDQQLCNQELDSHLDQDQPESAPIKEEEEELFTSQDEELLLKDETDNVSIAAAHEDYNHTDPILNGDHIPSHTSHVDGHSHSERSIVEDSGAARPAYADRKPEKCRQTKRNIVEESSLFESHCNTHHNEKKQYCCETCGETFKDKIKLTVHMRFHTDEKLYSCQTCGKSFYTNSHLLYHVRTHTGEKPYSCKICGKCFCRNCDLLRHMRTHTGEKPHSCQTCGKRFSSTSDCLRHARTHTGEKPYSCKTCGKCFGQNFELVSHMRIHTGEKPYSCKTCGKCFSQSSARVRHMRTHTGQKPYSCQTCGKGFCDKPYFLRHIRNCTGRKPYSC